MGKFKVGDKIKCRFSSGCGGFKQGHTYTVSKIADGSISVETDSTGRPNGWAPEFFDLVEEAPQFQVGDIVEAFGLRGKVISTKPDDEYPIGVKYDDEDERDSFTSDGKYIEYHKTPSLKLISRAKKTKKVMMYPALFHYKYLGEYTISDQLFANEEEARKNNPQTFIKLLTDRGVEVEVKD